MYYVYYMGCSFVSLDYAASIELSYLKPESHCGHRLGLILVRIRTRR